MGLEEFLDAKKFREQSQGMHGIFFGELFEIFEDMCWNIVKCFEVKMLKRACAMECAEFKKARPVDVIELDARFCQVEA